MGTCGGGEFVVVEHPPSPTSNPAATIIDTIVSHIAAPHLSSVLTRVHCTRVPVRSLETNSNLEKLCDLPPLFFFFVG